LTNDGWHQESRFLQAKLFRELYQMPRVAEIVGKVKIDMGGGKKMGELPFLASLSRTA
jgi:hypothetical protein